MKFLAADWRDSYTRTHLDGALVRATLGAEWLELSSLRCALCLAGESLITPLDARLSDRSAVTSRPPPSNQLAASFSKLLAGSRRSGERKRALLPSARTYFGDDHSSTNEQWWSPSGIADVGRFNGHPVNAYFVPD